MEQPLKAFEINDGKGNFIKLAINEIYGYPNEPSFRGGYDINCDLTIKSGLYCVETDRYLSTTGALYNFYSGLNKAYKDLNGSVKYEVYTPENDLTFTVTFESGNVKITGKYQDDPAEKNILNFEFRSDQSFFPEVLRDLKTVFNFFGLGSGK